MNFFYYIKTAFKALLKNKSYSFFNILGLSAGLGLAIIILLYVKHELNYDTQLPDSENIYRLTTNGTTGSNMINDALTPMPLLGIVESLPETESATRIIPGANKLIKHNTSAFGERKFFFSDTSFFDVFNLKILKGSLKSFSQPGTVVITSKTASTYFNKTNPVGKTIKRGGMEYTVIAVCRDMPEASHFHFNFLASLSSVNAMFKDTPEKEEKWKNNWLMLSCYTYVKVKKGTDIALYENLLNKKKKESLAENIANTNGNNPVNAFQADFRIKLQPIGNIYLYSGLTSEIEPVSNPVHVIIFVSVAVFILIITSINFINITTAQPVRQLKESAVRKLYGATRHQLIIQIFTEAFIISSVSTFLGFALAELTLPLFNKLFGLHLNISDIHGFEDIGPVILLIFFVGIASAAYPAKFFSKIDVNNIFRKNLTISKSTFNIRGTILASHIFVVLFLSVLTAGIWWQTNFLKNKDLGFNEKNLLILERGSSVKKDFDDFKKDLKAVKGVINVSSSMSLPGEEYFKMSFNFKDDQKKQELMLPVNHVDCDYLETMGLKLKKGAFLNCRQQDSMGIILNSSAIKLLNIKKPLEEHFETGTESVTGSWKINILGVINDYNYEPLTKKIRPLGLMLLCNRSHLFRYIIIKLEDRNDAETLNAIHVLWNKYTGNEPMESFFLKDKLEGLYRQDNRMFKAVAIFTVFAYLISILGFISLASFLIEYKNKRISYLRTIGIPDNYILRLVIGSFWKFVLTSISLSIPLAIVTIKIWFKNYAYTETVPVWSYVIITAFVMAIAAGTIILQYYKIVIRSNRFNLFKAG